MAFGYDGSIRIDTNVNSGGFNKGISSMSQALRGLAGVIGAAFGVAAIVNFGRESVKAASRLSSALIGLQSIVEGQGRSFQKAQGFIDDYIKDGLVPMQDAVAAYKNLAMRGYSTEQIEKTMVALKDASAFGRNASMSMGDAVSSASEGLKNENSLLVDNAGVTKNVAKMWDDYAKSIGTTANKLTQQQKIQAEVNGILEESRYQVGDAEKVAGTYAGQISVLSFNFEKLKVAVGEAIIPIAQAVLPAVNTMLTAFTELANVVAQVTTALFGSTAVKDQTESTEDLADSEKDAADSAGDMAGATDDAGAAAEKAAKKIKGSLAPFDDLKKITGSTAESMEDAAGSMEDQFDNIGGDKTLFGDVKVSEDILNFVDRLKDGLQELADIMKRIWKPFEDAWNKYGKKVVDAVKGALSAIWELMKAIGRTFLEVWENSGAEMILAGILGILAGILGFIQTLAGQMKTVWDEMGQDLVEALFFALSSVIELVYSIGSAFAEAWNSGVGEEILRTIMGILTDIFNIVGTLTTKMREAWEANRNGVAIWTSILEIVSSVLGFVERLTGATLEWLGGVEIEPLVGSFRRLLESVEPLVDIILGGLAWAYENVLLPLAGWVVEDAFPKWIDMVSEAVKLLTETLEALQPSATWLWENFLAPLIGFAWDLIIAKIDMVTNVLRNLSTWMSENEETVQAIIIALGTFFALLAVTTIVTSINRMVDTLFLMATAMGAAGVATAMSNAAFLILAGAILLVTNTFDKMSGMEKVIAVLSTVIAVATVAAITFGTLSSAMTMGLAAVAIVAGIVAITTAINSATRSAKSSIPKYSAGSFSGGRSAIPQAASYSLPHLANGAVIPPNQQFAAILGDQTHGRNFEAPESLLRQIVREEMSGASGGSFTVEMPVYLDGREVYRNQQTVSTQMGKSFTKRF